MNRNLDNLELEIERDLARLGPRLDVAPLPRERIDALSHRLVSEAVRRRAVRRLFGFRAVGLSGAAAVLLATAFGWLHTQPAVQTLDGPTLDGATLADAERAVDDWMSAAAGSSDLISSAVQRPWTAPESSSDATADDAVESFIESFDRIAVMTGAS
ncbi:MAG: hypothetical protein IT450_19705 [Phycisphaerales bacterium]|nr:hypothetical protein [Phycisphaerales bacterium]